MTVKEKDTYSNEPYLSRIEEHIIIQIKIGQRESPTKGKDPVQEYMQTNITLIQQ